MPLWGSRLIGVDVAEADVERHEHPVVGAAGLDDDGVRGARETLVDDRVDLVAMLRDQRLRPPASRSHLRLGHHRQAKVRCDGGPTSTHSTEYDRGHDLELQPVFRGLLGFVWVGSRPGEQFVPVVMAVCDGGAHRRAGCGP
jgi:hypothetical protein